MVLVKNTDNKDVHICEDVMQPQLSMLSDQTVLCNELTFLIRKKTEHANFDSNSHHLITSMQAQRSFFYQILILSPFV